MTVEQMVRDLLTASVNEGLVEEVVYVNGDIKDPQNWSAGDMTATANLLSRFLKEAIRRAKEEDTTG